MCRTTAAGFCVRIAARLLLSTTLLAGRCWGEGSLLYRLSTPPDRSMWTAGEEQGWNGICGIFSIINVYNCKWKIQFLIDAYSKWKFVLIEMCLIQRIQYKLTIFFSVVVGCVLFFFKETDILRGLFSLILFYLQFGKRFWNVYFKKWKITVFCNLFWYLDICFDHH